MERINVISPVGEEVVRQAALAPRLADLDGKTVCEIWVGGFKGNQTFAGIRKLLRARYPNVRIVPYTEFSFYSADSPHQQRLAREVAALAKEKGADALISGNGA